jgi:hypothetical protein
MPHEFDKKWHFGSMSSIQKKEIEAYLLKADTLVGTGKGKPRLRPLRLKCGGGG